MTEYSTMNSRRLQRYYEKAGKERALNPQLFDRRVMKGYEILKKLLSGANSDRENGDA